MAGMRECGNGGGDGRAGAAAVGAVLGVEVRGWTGTSRGADRSGGRGGSGDRGRGKEGLWASGAAGAMRCNGAAEVAASTVGIGAAARANADAFLDNSVTALGIIFIERSCRVGGQATRCSDAGSTFVYE